MTCLLFGFLVLQGPADPVEALHRTREECQRELMRSADEAAELLSLRAALLRLVFNPAQLNRPDGVSSDLIETRTSDKGTLTLTMNPLFYDRLPAAVTMTHMDTRLEIEGKWRDVSPQRKAQRFTLSLDRYRQTAVLRASNALTITEAAFRVVLPSRVQFFVRQARHASEEVQVWNGFTRLRIAPERGKPLVGEPLISEKTQLPDELKEVAELPTFVPLCDGSVVRLGAERARLSEMDTLLLKDLPGWAHNPFSARHVWQQRLFEILCRLEALDDAFQKLPARTPLRQRQPLVGKRARVAAELTEQLKQLDTAVAAVTLDVARLRVRSDTLKRRIGRLLHERWLAGTGETEELLQAVRQRAAITLPSSKK